MRLILNLYVYLQQKPNIFNYSININANEKITKCHSHGCASPRSGTKPDHTRPVFG